MGSCHLKSWDMGTHQRTGGACHRENVLQEQLNGVQEKLHLVLATKNSHKMRWPLPHHRRYLSFLTDLSMKSGRQRDVNSATTMVANVANVWEKLLKLPNSPPRAFQKQKLKRRGWCNLHLLHRWRCMVVYLGQRPKSLQAWVQAVIFKSPA